MQTIISSLQFITSVRTMRVYEKAGITYSDAATMAAREERKEPYTGVYPVMLESMHDYLSAVYDALLDVRESPTPHKLLKTPPLKAALSARATLIQYRYDALEEELDRLEKLLDYIEQKKDSLPPIEAIEAAKEEALAPVPLSDLPELLLDALAEQPSNEELEREPEAPTLTEPVLQTPEEILKKQLTDADRNSLAVQNHFNRLSAK